jgi:hypothetical protein
MFNTAHHSAASKITHVVAPHTIIMGRAKVDGQYCSHSVTANAGDLSSGLCLNVAERNGASLLSNEHVCDEGKMGLPVTRVCVNRRTMPLPPSRRERTVRDRCGMSKIDHLYRQNCGKRLNMPISDLSLDFVCPTCGADPQEKCEMNSGTPRFESHLERWDIAKNHTRDNGFCEEQVASILERNATATIADWLSRVKRDDGLNRIVLSDEERTGHLPKLIRELIHRLRVPRSLGTKQVSEAAVEHGKVRRSQGYSIPMIIEESRMVQVSIFQTLQTNHHTVDFGSLLNDVTAIADEVDSQLRQTVVSFTETAAATVA